MKTKFLALLFTCACLLSCFTVCAADAEPTETTTDGQSVECNTKEKLLDFLKLNDGGTLTLTGDIMWDFTYHDRLLITQPTVIEMGKYCIIIPTGCMMQIQGPVTFRGEGSVLFETAGLLNLSYGVELLSTGENATAIRCAPMSDLQLFICNIDAAGANSTAIQSADPVTVQLCRVSATKAAIEAPEITLDAASVLPELTEATVIERIPTLDRSFRLYGITLPVDVSCDQYNEAIYGYGYLQYAFIDPESGNAIGGPLACAWSGIPTWPAEAGSYTLTVKPTDLPEWFPVEIPSFDIPLHIVDKNTLWLNVVYGDPYFGILALQFTPNIPAETAQITLFYSVDEGQTWKNVKEDFTDSTVMPDFIDIVGLEQNTGYRFYAEVTDGSVTEKSNTIYYPNFISYPDVDFSHGGGDRDEDDFGDQGENPPPVEIVPPLETVPPTDTETPSTDTVPPIDSASEPVFAPTSDITSEPTVDRVTVLTQQPYCPEPVISDSTETTEDADKAESTSQTDNNTVPLTDKANTEVQEDEASFRTFDTVLIILCIAVVGGIVCIFILWRKGGRK